MTASGTLHQITQRFLPGLSIALTASLVALAIAISSLWIQQREQYLQLGNVQHYASALTGSILREEFLLHSDLQQMLSNNSPMPVVAHKLLNAYPSYLRIELRGPQGQLLQAYNKPGSDSYWAQEPRDVLSPSVQINYTKAQLLRDPLWSRSVTISGHNIIELIRPLSTSENCLVFIQLEDQWQPDRRSIALDKPALVSFTSIDRQMENNETYDALTLPGLDLRIVFSPPDSPLVGRLELPHMLIGLLSMTLALTTIRTIYDRRRMRLDRVKLDQQAQHIESVSQMSLLGELASTLAHEINQPLAAAVNYIASCEILLGLSDLTHKTPMAQALASARQQALRAGEVISSVRQLIQQKPPNPRQLDVHEQINHITPILKLICSQASATIDIKAHAIQINIDPVLLELVIINFIKNGIESMSSLPPRGRKISLQARTIGPADWHLQDSDDYTARIQAQPASHMAIEVTDQGVGMADNDARSIMDKYFTTKFDHMGIGLSFCRSVAENYGGAIRWKSRAGQGSTFALILPITTNTNLCQQPAALT